MNSYYDSFKTTELIILGILDSEIEQMWPPYSEYFQQTFTFAHLMIRIRHDLEDADYMTPEELAELNVELYEHLLPDNYEHSFANPEYAVKASGIEIGRVLSAIAAEVYSAIPYVYNGDSESLLLRLHLLYDTYSICKRFDYAESDDNEIAMTLRSVLYTYVYENYPREMRLRLRAKLDPDHPMINIEEIIGTRGIDELCEYIHTEECTEKLLRMLYLSGEYISDNETQLIRKFAATDSKDLISMADTYVEGYITGFAVTGKDISIKDVVELRFNLGFLPLELISAKRFLKSGLRCSMERAPFNIFGGRSVEKNGVFGANINPQFDMDHKDDLSLILDEDLNKQRINALRDAYKELWDLAAVQAGPAVMEIFGEPDYEPVIKSEAPAYDENTRKLKTGYSTEAGIITNKFIPGDERSYTIISYPVPSIGDNFEEVFDATVRINTLDYDEYAKIQKKIIDALDTARFVYVKGMGDNRTDMRVHLHKLKYPESETNFENCVADVNIPVGEVFTSPLLALTEGTLHVTHVYLNGIEYHDLEIEVKDGYVTDYNCAEGKKLIEDNILFNHETLPIGEFAIGTNTTAYVLSRRLGIENKLPILIAEKTGPHFAFGDTCYSHCEDLRLYNPDGKEVTARDNEASVLRLTDPSKAYFNCHTDITIPFDELGSIRAVSEKGDSVDIISGGRFVLEGCEKLNEPFDKF